MTIQTPAMLEAIKGKDEVKGLVYPNGTVFMIVMLSFLGLQYFWFFCVFLVSYLCQPVRTIIVIIILIFLQINLGIPQ